MKKTYVDVLLELPVDRTLRAFISDHGLPVPDNFTWRDLPETSQTLVDLVSVWLDVDARDRLIGNLMASMELSGAASKQALFQAAVTNGAALAGLASCRSDLHRSFWLYVNHYDLFDRASEFDYLERHGSRAQQHDLGVQRQPDSSDIAVAALRAAISDFYQRELQCGDSSVAYFLERSPGVFLLTVHVKDLAMLSLEFKGVRLRRRVGNPNIHMVLEYAQTTGVVRTLVRGGAKYHQMLVDAFAEHLLGTRVDAQRIKTPTLDLSVLRVGFDVPQAMSDGFIALQVKSISVLSPDTALKLDCTAMASSEQRCVTELLRDAFPGDDPLSRDWLITAARINLYYPPLPGKTRSKVVTIEVTRRGRLNLHKFDPTLQAQLEGYLVSLGILQPGQTLNAQEALHIDVADDDTVVLEERL